MDTSQKSTDPAVRQANIESTIRFGVLTFTVGLFVLTAVAGLGTGSFLGFIGIYCIPVICLISLLLPIVVAVKGFDLTTNQREQPTTLPPKQFIWATIGDTFYEVRYAVVLLTSALLLAIPILGAASTIVLDAALDGIWLTPTREFSFSEIAAAGSHWLIFNTGLLSLNLLLALLGVYVGLETSLREAYRVTGLVLIAALVLEILLAAGFLLAFWWFSINYHEIGRLTALFGGCIIVPACLGGGLYIASIRSQVRSP